MAAALPAQYKSLGHYLKLSNEHAQRDPAVHYWSLFYLVQSAMQIDRKLPECVRFLSEKMKQLENLKAQLKGNETVVNELVAQAHIEQYALKLFLFADNEDRASHFNKNTIKAFYTAGHLFDILTLFGELDEKLAETRKYAKWKAGYLFTCLKTGETPVPGPSPGSEDTATRENLIMPGSEDSGNGAAVGGTPSDVHRPPTAPPRGTKNTGETTAQVSEPRCGDNTNSSVAPSISGVSTEELVEAQKCCKYAISALEYEDVPTAISNLEKALLILKTEL